MWQTFRKLYYLLDRRERRRMALLLAMIFGMAALETAGVGSIMPFAAVLVQPDLVQTHRYLRMLYEALPFSTPQQFLLFLGSVVFVVLILSTGFKALTTWAMLRFSSRWHHLLSRRMFEDYLHRPYVWFLRRHSANLGKSVLSEVSQVVNGGLTPGLHLIGQSAIALFLVALLVVVDPVLAVSVSVTLGGAYGLVFWATRRYMGRIGEERVHANRERFRHTAEAFGGIKDVKVLGLEEALLRRFEDPSHRFARSQATSEVVAQLPQYVLQMITYGGLLVVVEYQLLAETGLTSGVPLIALYALAGSRLLPALEKVYLFGSKLRFSKPAVDQLYSDLMEKVDGAEPDVSTPALLRPIEHGVELRRVRYRYPGASTTVLDDLSLSIPARATVGLVGRTGAGKTTLADVILGLLPPERGAILVDGTPISAQNRRSWQRRIGYVPQQIFLCDDTVASNIAFGLAPGEIDLAAVERAARIANLHAFVTEELELGYQTLVGERGVRLSGGQRQRVGIARALYHDPDLVIMDEATSALDNVTERAVMDAVENLAHRKTVVLIAHRLTTVRRCDIIFLLENGTVAASGTFDELVSDSAPFRAMVESASF